jgi:small subunit ribosomal protein S4
MKIGPKYKIARRLGAAVFEKTQSAKFTVAEQKKLQNQKRGYKRAPSNYGMQLIEKQRVKYTYGISQKQLGNYIKQVAASGSKNPATDLYKKLETRLDTVLLRSGMAKTRFQARQAASHGHFTVNGRKATIPSMQIKKTDEIVLKEAKRESPLYMEYPEYFKNANIPTWVAADPKTFSIKIIGEPTYNPTGLAFDLLEVIQFFKR